MSHVPVHANRVATLVLAGALALAIPVTLGACAPTPSPGLPHGVTIDVYQSRIDYSEHKLEVAIANATDAPFDVLALSFSTPVFSSVEYTRAPTTVRPGTTTDFRLLLPPARCDAEPGKPTVDIRFSFDGGEGQARMSPDDRMGQLPAIAAEDCRDDAVAAVATISAAPAIRIASVDGTTAAVLDFTAVPTGAGGILTIDDVRGTVLLGARDPATGRVGDTVPLGIDLSHATTPVTFSLVLLPARCDPHVVLEDKRGTFFTFTVTTRLDTGRIFIGVTDDVRLQLYEFVGSQCGWT